MSPASARQLGMAIALTVAGACGSARPPSSIPDTPAGVAFREWLNAYNAADSTALDVYTRRYEPAMSVHTQLALRAQTGPYNLVSVERSEPRHLDVLLRAGENGGALTIYGTMDLGIDAAHRTATMFTLIDKAPTRQTVIVIPNSPRRALLRLGGAERAAAVESIAAKVTRLYVQPDLARRVADSLRARAARGSYDEPETAVGFAHTVTRELVALSGDRQLGVAYAWQVPLPPSTPTPPALLHCGLEPSRMLADGVGYALVYGFGGHDPTCGQSVSTAMQAVADARALILDLREAQDDSWSGMAYLASYLVGDCTPLGALWDRRTGRTEAVWTRDGLPGPAFGGGKPLVILTSARTFAAAEALTDALLRAGRAVVIGDRTGGGAHVTASGLVGEHLLLTLPVARAVEPATGANWQGVGIEPDVRVPADEALDTARRLLRERRLPRPRVGRAQHSDVPREADVGNEPRSPEAVRSRRGIRFAIDTNTRSDASWHGQLTQVAGVVEFADGRGRLDVTAVRRTPALSINGVTLGAPLARSGDYYLFDNTGAVLVRPGTRTFSRIAFTRTDYNHTGALLPGAYLMWDTPGAADTLAVSDARRWQHAPITIHWHMQPPDLEQSATLYARGWLEIADAPAAEAGVARWFEVAAALATRPGGVAAFARDGRLEVTSAVLLRRPGARKPTVTYTELLAPHGIAATSVDATRLLLPAGFAETPWPSFKGLPRRRETPSSGAAHWRTLGDRERQRIRAACRQAWVPEPPA